MPRAMAALSLVWGASAFLGPLVGGLFVTHSSWRAGFAFFGLQAAALGLWICFGLKAAEPPAERSAARLPLFRLLLLCGAILAVASAGIAPRPSLMALSLCAGLAALVLFARIDAASGESRLWPRGAFDPRRGIGAGLIMLLAINIATMGFPAYGPLLLDRIHGTSALVAGYIVATVSIAWTLGAVVVAGSPARRDPMMIAGGITLVAASVALSLYAVPNGPLGLVALAALIEGFGFGMAWTFIIRRAAVLSPPEDEARMAAALPTIGRLGYALGAAVMGIFANRAGFGAAPPDAASAETATYVARAIFGGSLPIAILAWFAMLRFVTARALR